MTCSRYIDATSPCSLFQQQQYALDSFLGSFADRIPDKSDKWLCGTLRCLLVLEGAGKLALMIYITVIEQSARPHFLWLTFDSDTARTEQSTSADSLEIFSSAVSESRLRLTSAVSTGDISN